MNVNGTPYRSIRREGYQLQVIDQTVLPHQFRLATLTSIHDVAHAIRHMIVRGAPLIGITSAYGLALALRENATDTGLQQAIDDLQATRPTAVNLQWALQQLAQHVRPLPLPERAQAALLKADELAEHDVSTNARIGELGGQLLAARWQELGKPARLNVLTHCNAGWLGCVDWGTALAGIYHAWQQGVPVHVWIDETRPRNQGASLTTWELQSHGIPSTLITDNAGGYLMRAGQVDACIVGADRVSTHGDVCNKVGTYLKALAAADNHIPFYVALPVSTIDWNIQDGQQEIEIEDRGSEEVTHIWGRGENGQRQQVQLAPDGTHARNPAFDITPARLVTALITEKGIVPATADGVAGLR